MLGLKVKEFDGKHEVKLMTLLPGDRFRSDNLEGGWVYGTLIYTNASRARVYLEGNQKQVVFGGTDGRTRTFEAQGGCEVNWPLEIMVEPEEYWGLPHTDGSTKAAKQQRVEDPRERNTMAEASVAQAAGLQARYSHASKQLAMAIEAKDAAKTEQFQARVTSIKNEAETKGIKLQEATTANGAKAPTKASSKPEAKTAKKTEAEKAEQRKANLAKVPKKGAAKEKAEKAPKSTHDCICGCGRETGGLYAPGHDARVKGILLQVERGKLKKEDVPEGVKPFVKWSGSWGKEGFSLVAAPVKVPGRDDVENTTQTALETLNV